MKKIILILVSVLIVFSVLYFFVIKKKKTENLSQDSEDRIAVVEKGQLILKVNTTGRVVSNLDVEIKSKASGEIVLLPFDVSDSVKKGDLLVELDPVDEQRNVSLKETSLSSSEARLAQSRENLKISQINLENQKKTVEASYNLAQIRHEEAKSKLERNKELFEKKLISQEELDASITSEQSAKSQLADAEASVAGLKTLEKNVELRKQDVKLAESQVISAQIDLDLAKRRLSETKIYAPMDGVVSSRNVQIGQIIASGISNVGGGTTILTISDLSHLYVIASIDESDIGKVKIGQTVLITADAYPGKRFMGKVERIATKGTNQSNVIIFDVKIEIFGDGIKVLKPEMTANVEITADRKENILLLPNEAIKFGDDYYYVELASPSPSSSDKKPSEFMNKQDMPGAQISKESDLNKESPIPKEIGTSKESGEQKETPSSFDKRDFRARRRPSESTESQKIDESNEQKPPDDNQEKRDYRDRRRFKQTADSSENEDKGYPQTAESKTSLTPQGTETPKETGEQKELTSSQDRRDYRDRRRPSQTTESGQSSDFRSRFQGAQKGSAESLGNRKKIEIGISDGLKTEIISGLKEGDKVLLSKGMSGRWIRSEGQSGQRQLSPRDFRVMSGGSGGGGSRR